MKIRRIISLLLILWLCSSSQSFAQVMYRSRYKTALLFEGFGLSPIMSANVEFAPIRLHKSYFSGRIGAGYMPANLGNGAGISLPLGLSYNFILKNLEKGITNRVMNRCVMIPPKFDIEHFMEIGPGYSYVYYPSSQTSLHNFNATLAFKSQMFLAIPPKTKVLYLKVSLTPIITKGKLILLQKFQPANPGNPLASPPIPPTPGRTLRFYGGFALGISI